MTYRELNLPPFEETRKDVKIGDYTFSVLERLPIRARIAFVEFIAQNSIDNETGTFDPLKIEIFFSLALVRWYADITFEDGDDLLEAYDALEEEGIINGIVSFIGQDEFQFMKELVDTTLSDLAKYNSSFIGVIKAASSDTSQLDSQITELLEKVKNREGMELLGSIKDVVGTD